MGPRLKIASISTVALLASVAIALGNHVVHRPKPLSPEGLAEQADALSWKNQWVAAKPLYEKARVGFLKESKTSEALYAEVSQVPVDVERTSVSEQLIRLVRDLQSPAAAAPRTKLRVLEILGMIETNYDAGLAEKTWAEVGTLAARQHHYMLASRASGEEGIAAYLLGDTATAKRKVLAAWEIAKHLGDPGAHIRYASLYGAGQVDLHQYKASLAALDEAIDTANCTGAAYPTIAVNAKIEALSGLGRYPEAFSLLAQAEERERPYGFKPHMVELERLRGNVYEAMGDLTRAGEAYSGAMQQAQAVGYWRGVMQIGDRLAGVYESINQLPLALSTVDRALEASKQIPEEIYLSPRLLARKAEILARLGRTKEAQSLYQKAADLIDGFLIHAPTPGIERDLIAQLGNVYSGFFNLLCDQKRYPEAFHVLEEARGRIEGQALEHHQAIDPTHLSLAEQSLALLNTQLLQTDDPTKRSQLLGNISTTEARFDNSALAERTAISPVALTELQRDLEGQEVVLEYSLDDTQSYVLAVTRSTVQRYALGPRREIEDAAAAYRRALSKGKVDTTLAETLFNKVLRVAPEYRTKRSIIVVPDGKLSLLPFAALMDSGSYVVADHVVSTVPSSTVLHLIRTRAESEKLRLPYVGVAAWTRPSSPLALVRRAVEGPEESEFLALPESRHEVENVGADLPKPSTLLLGGDATETRFKRLPLHSFNVLHLALHGYADLAYPDRSALAFAPETGGGNDGLLQIREIRRLNLDASLVTLSACNTGVGPTGEAGVANLANAFIEAGAKTVVSTLWELNDQATAQLMADFYKRLAAGTEKGEALRQAQFELAKTGAAPYYWASFQIVGDPDSALFPLDVPSSTASASISKIGR